MELVELKTFVTVVAEHSFSLAAIKLCRTQPAVSQAIRRLEADLSARAKLAGVLRELRPRVLFAPYWEDAHPDHVAASALVDAARFWAKLTKTDLPGAPRVGRTSGVHGLG